MAGAAGDSGSGAALTYWERQPPFAALALGKYAGVGLQHAADPKATKETVPTLRFPGG